MSATYPELTNTQFPDKIDTINNFVDITLTALPLAQEYYQKYNSGDIEGANQILLDNPDLKYSYIGASTLNPIVDAIKALQMFYMSDVQQYLMSIVQHKGDFSATTKYTKYNTVSYLHNSALEVFMCSKHDTPIGTLPTNLSYWIPITMRGEQGEAGIGLSAHGTWNPLITYQPDSMVAYNNALWGSIIENTGIAPSDTATSTWYKIIQFSADLLFFNDIGTSTSYQIVVNNGSIYLKSDTTQIDIALKSDIPTTLPASGGTAGTISTTLPITKGGTGSTTVAGARNALGLGNTSGALPVANGGTGSTTSAGALTNLGVTATASELNIMDGVTASTTEINHIKGVTANVQAQINGKAPTTHSHTKAQISDFPSSLPANGGNSSTVGGFTLTTSTVVPTSLSTNTFCFVYE